MKSRFRLLRPPPFFMLLGSLACASMLASCGLKGPLYMPNPQASQQKISSSSTKITQPKESSSSTPEPASSVYVPPAPK